MAQPGDVIHVLPGTYGAVTTSTSGTASSRIRFVSDTKWGALIRTTGVQQMWYNTGNYLDIVGFDLSGDGRLGILNEGSFVRTIGNNVHNIPAPCTSDGGAGIDNANYAASDDDVIGNVVHDIGPTMGSCNTAQGIYQSNLRGHIYNNIVYRVSAWGISLWHAANNVTISGNLLFNNGGPGVGGGIIVGDGDSPGGVTDDYTVVTNNIVVHNGGVGIEEDGAVGSHNVYANNLLYQNYAAFALLYNTAVGTLSVDPQLVNYQPDGSGNYQLAVGSPAINAGTNQGAPSNDFAGGARPVGGAYDIGAYEYGAIPGTWPYE
jgi:hypothetical protein